MQAIQNSQLNSAERVNAHPSSPRPPSGDPVSSCRHFGFPPKGAAGMTRKGFTLLELMVVIFIISLAAAVVLPRLPAPEGTRLKSSARNLATTIRFLNDQAIITKQVYRLRFNMTDNTVSITRLAASGIEGPPDDQLLNRKVIEEGISVEDLTIPRLGKVSEGEVTVPFGPGGNQDCLTVHLKGG